MAEQLIFVYNVDASPVALLKDLYIGVKTGSTDCHLCDLTFGRLLKDRTWRSFVDELPYEVDFQMRSTFAREHPGAATAGFPAAFLDDGTTVREVLASSVMNNATDLDDLRRIVGDLVATLSQRPDETA